MTAAPDLDPGSGWGADDIPDQHGRTFLVTGANRGLGLATTRALARRGGRVVMAVRDPARGEQARQRLWAEHPAAELELRRLDLADLVSVRQCARALVDDRVPVDVLINNAGVMMPPRSLSRQGFELQFAVNHLGHFALTGLLLPTLRDGRGARVVTVVSELHRLSFGDFADLTAAAGYRPEGSYARSTLANALFGLELDRRLRAAAVPVRSLLAHPGYAATDLVRGPGGVLRRVLGLTRLVAQDAAGGALSQLYAATAPAARGGQYVGPAGLVRGSPRVLTPSATARDPQLAGQLWQRCEELTGVRYGLPAA